MINDYSQYPKRPRFTVQLILFVGIVLGALCLVAFLASGVMMVQGARTQEQSPDTSLANRSDDQATIEALQAADGAGSPSSAASASPSTNAIPLNGLQSHVIDVNRDAWSLIQAHNQYNDPPLDGYVMMMITLEVTNTSDDIISVDYSEYDLVDKDNRVFPYYDVSCGVVPDALDSTLAPGQSSQGNICFQVNTPNDPYRLNYEALLSAGQAIIEVPNDGDPLPQPGYQPVIRGIDADAPNGLTIELVDLNYDAWPLIEAHNQNNDPPLPGFTMMLATLRVTNVDGAAGEPLGVGESDFKLIGDRGVEYETFQVSCHVTPDDLDTTLLPGDSTLGTVCFQVSESEAEFKLVYKPSFDSLETVLPLPDRSEVR